MSYHIIIPARYHSQRLPGKVLRDLNGQTLLQRVYQQAKQTSADQIIIATDHSDVADAAQAMGAMCCMTHSDYTTGSDRIGEVVQQLGLSDDTIIVNVQGDEAFIPPQNIDCVAQLCIQQTDAAMTTLYEEIDDVADVFDPNVVKVVFNQAGHALYFSRAPISWERDHFEQKTQSMSSPHYRHIGLYAYRVGGLKTYVNLPPSPDEQAEKLEQLRFLWYGKPIYITRAPQATPLGIDTEADLQRARRACLD